jgi:hypothetical protein
MHANGRAAPCHAAAASAEQSCRATHERRRVYEAAPAASCICIRRASRQTPPRRRLPRHAAAAPAPSLPPCRLLSAAMPAQEVASFTAFLPRRFYIDRPLSFHLDDTFLLIFIHIIEMYTLSIFLSLLIFFDTISAFDFRH